MVGKFELTRLARHVGVAGAVHGDARAIVTAAAAEVGGVDQGALPVLGFSFVTKALPLPPLVV